MLKKYWLIFLSTVITIFSCNVKTNKEVNEIVNQWSGKKIIFSSDFLFAKLEKDTIKIDSLLMSNFKILTYLDSIGCTSCKLKLHEWKKMIYELDSVANGSVKVLFFMYPKDKKEIIYLLKRDNFDYPVCIDEADYLNKLNHFPSDGRFHTFLLDQNNKILAIGNPVDNLKVKELYMKIILGDKALEKKDEIKTIAELESSFIDFGEFDWKVEQKATFKLKNTGTQPLVILDVATSCGCISAEFPKEPVAAGKEAEITVVYKGDKPEHFNKTVTVYCNAENSSFTVKVSGTAK